MKPWETRILYFFSGAALATSILMICWLRSNIYPQLDFLFHQYIVGDEFKIKVQDELYRIKEIEKQNPNITKEIP